MELAFTGLGPTVALAVLAAAAAVLVAAFLVRPARRTVVVPSLARYRADRTGARARAPARWPARLAGLLLALAAVAAVVLAASGPVATAARAGSRTVLAIDVSPSMAAGARAEEAREAALRVVDALPDREPLLVAMAAGGLVPLTPWTRDREAARAAIARVAPGGAALAPGPVLDDAATLAGREPVRVVLVSDLGFASPRVPDGVSLQAIRVGSTAGNVTLAGLAVRLEPGRRDLATVLATVTATGRDARGVVTLRTAASAAEAGVLAAAAAFEAAPGRPARLRLEHVPLSGPRLEAVVAVDGEAGEVDGLASDDVLAVALPGARRLSVRVAGGPDVFLDAALAVQPGVEVTRSESVPDRDPGVDLLVVDDLPGAIPAGPPVLVLGPRPGNGRVEVTGAVDGPEVDEAQEGDPLVQGLVLADLNVGEAAGMRPGPADRVVLASRAGQALVLRRDAAGERTVALAFPMRESDLGLRYAWPVLVSNVLAWAAGASSDYARAAAAAGEDDRDLSARCELPAFEAATEGVAGRLAGAFGSDLAALAALLGVVLLCLEWWMAARRPDAGA